MLARQTGLTRSQVSNWFINARVRLWKPMVEEMYKEELGDAEMDSNSSSENAAKATKGDMGTSEDRGEEFQQSASSTATERCSAGQLMDPKSDHVPDMEMAGSTTRSNFQNGTTHHGFVSMRGDDDIYNAASSVGAGATDFECLNPGNRQHRFSSSHVFHDFVA